MNHAAYSVKRSHHNLALSEFHQMLTLPKEINDRREKERNHLSCQRSPTEKQHFEMHRTVA